MTGTPRRWCFVTVTYNSADAIAKFWARVNLPADIEWVVVDNASKDNSAEIAGHLGARVIRLKKNVGFGSANNVGFDASKSDYVAFVNPDVTPIVSDLLLLEKVIDADPYSLVAPQLLNADGSLQPNGRGKPYLVYKILHRLKPEYVAAKYRLYARPGQTREVDWLTGAVVAGARSRLAELGPWDERFFIYYEDTDLCLRNAEFGGRSLLLGDAVWVHGWARDTATMNLGAWKHELVSMLRFYSRYPAFLIPFRALYEKRMT